MTPEDWKSLLQEMVRAYERGQELIRRREARTAQRLQALAAPGNRG